MKFVAISSEPRNNLEKHGPCLRSYNNSTARRSPAFEGKRPNVLIGSAPIRNMVILAADTSGQPVVFQINIEPINSKTLIRMAVTGDDDCA